MGTDNDTSIANRSGHTSETTADSPRRAKSLLVFVVDVGDADVSTLDERIRELTQRFSDLPFDTKVYRMDELGRDWSGFRPCPEELPYGSLE